ncbi:MAG TPA: response regulator transcription factor [Opitutaceae bacterium]|nr:response regulator transcription factor [Rhodothermia bacterium]
MSQPSPAPAPKSRIVVVDDHPFFREGLVGWLNRQPGLVCCGEAGTVNEGLEVIEAAKPDLVLLDLQLKTGDGLDLLNQLSSRALPPPVIVISHKDEDVFAARAFRAGARAYLMKEEAPETMLAAIRTVLSGQFFRGTEASSDLLGTLMHMNQPGPNRLQDLSDRELQVFELLGRGFSSKAVASELSLSVKTVESCRERLKKKLGLPDSIALVRSATLWEQLKQPPD